MTTPSYPSPLSVLNEPASPIAGLYPASDAEAKQRLLAYVREAPLGFGSWRYLKALFKQTETDALRGEADPELLGALLGRMDAAPLNLNADGNAGQVSLSDAQNLQAIAAAPAGQMVTLGVHYGRRGYIERLYRFDLANTTDPMKPRALGHADGPESYYWNNQYGTGRRLIVTSGGYAYTVGGDYQTRYLSCYDLSSERNPVLRGSLAISDTMIAHDIARSAPTGVLLVKPRRGNAQLQVLDLARTDALRTSGIVEVKGGVGGVVLSDDGKTAIVAVGGSGFTWTSLPKPGGLRLFDLADPERPRAVGALDLPAITSGAVMGNVFFVGVQHRSPQEPAGIHAFDISDPARPRSLGFMALEAHQTPLHLYVEPRRNLLIVGGVQQGVLLLDIAEPAHIRIIGQIGGFAASSFALRGDLLYAFTSTNTVTLINVADPTRTFRVGVPPSTGTMGYMKRRARRTLKTLAAKDPARYVEVAAAFLKESGKKRETVDRATQWASMDVLYGGSNHWVQQSHGRGTYTERRATREASTPLITNRIRLHLREERAPAAWNARPDLASGLLTEAELPEATYELAARVLRVARRPAPESLSDKTLARFLSLNSPLLIRIATERVAAKMARERKLAPALAADAYLLANAARRRTIVAALPAYLPLDGSWARAFAERLVERLNGQGIRTAETIRRRQGAALSLLASTILPALNDPAALTALLLPLLGPALATGRPDLVRFARSILERVDPLQVYQALEQLGDRSDAVLTPAWEAIGRAVAGKALNHATIWPGITHTSESVRRGMWRVVASSKTSVETLTTIWTQLFDAAVRETPALRTAMTWPDALLTLSRSQITADQIAARLAEKPFLVALLSPEAFAQVLKDAPASVALQLISAAPDALWTQLRAGLLQTLQQGVGLSVFWTALPAALDTDGDDRLAGRLLADSEIADTFLAIENADAALGIRNAAFASLLGRYVTQHRADWPRDSELLLTAASHALPEVREPALARIGELGMSLPFALRLLESEVPDAVAVGRGYFEAAKVDDNTLQGEQSEYALALCDSPVLSVRDYGRRFISARWETLPRLELYRALFENPNPDIQTFVATLLNEEPARPEGTAQFDGEVLRTRNRARRAKEAVKTRQEQAETPTVDVETLLSLARGADGTPRDAEWALVQLTRLALSGVAIEGFAVVEG